MNFIFIACNLLEKSCFLKSNDSVFSKVLLYYVGWFFFRRIKVLFRNYQIKTKCFPTCPRFYSVALKHLDEGTFVFGLHAHVTVDGSLGRNSPKQEPRAEPEAEAMKKGCLLAQPLWLI